MAIANSAAWVSNTSARYFSWHPVFEQVSVSEFLEGALPEFLGLRINIPSISELLSTGLDNTVSALLRQFLPSSLEPTTGTEADEYAARVVHGRLGTAELQLHSPVLSSLHNSAGFTTDPSGGYGKTPFTSLRELVQVVPSSDALVWSISLLQLLLFVLVIRSRRRHALQLSLLFLLSFLLLCSKHIGELCARLSREFPGTAFSQPYWRDIDSAHTILFVVWCCPLLSTMLVLSGVLVLELISSIRVLVQLRTQLHRRACVP
ncbi:hypothetical protein CSUI_007725, partial [Cystoisospora suis]